MDVYDLILDQGYIGALRYANKIESKNYRLASEIDDAVTRLYKNTRLAQGDPNNPANFAPGYNPNEDLTAPTQNNTATQQVRSAPAMGPASNYNPIWPLANAATIDVGKLQALKRGLALLYNRKLLQYKYLLQQGNTIEAAKILNNSPKDLSYLFGGNSVAIRSNFIQAAKDVLGPNSQTYFDFIHDAAGQYAQDAANTMANKAKGLIGKILPGQQKAGTFLHPGAQGFNMAGLSQRDLRGLQIGDIEKLMAKKDLSVALSNGAITADEFAQFAKEAPDAIAAFLGNIRQPTNFLNGFKNHLATNGAAASEALITNAAPANVGKLEGLISKLVGVGGKFEFLAPLLKLGGKVLGPLAVILDGKGFFDEYETYGFDNKTVCDLLSVLIGAASLIPPLTPFAGPAWLITSVGCALFAHHGDPLPGKGEQKQTQNTNSTTHGTFSGLSPEDQQLLTRLTNENQSSPDQLTTIVTDAISKGLFQNPDTIKQLLQQSQGNTQPSN